MKIKESLDTLFKDYKFDTALYKKILSNNIEFITKDNEHRNLFGSKLIGCHYVKYTMYNKNIFYSSVFGMDSEEVIQAIDKISTINVSFKIARDDINLTCFYIAHRFLSNETLGQSKRLEYAKEILNYFNYRTLVLISSSYFIYPISEEKALSLSERLSNRYVIKKLKNWNEYCKYRSDEYLDNKFLPLLMKFKEDKEIPNAIADLFNRTKDTLKNIYSEFIDMMDKDEVIKTKRNVINDIEGQEVIVDKLHGVDSYFIKLEALFTDKNTFIKKEYVDVTVDIINSTSYKQLEDTLNMSFEFSHSNKENYLLVIDYYKSVLINSIEYLNSNNIHINKKSNVLTVINSIVGNILYARGTDISVNKVKEDGDSLIKKIYKFKNKSIPDRTVSNIRNAVYVYIVLLALVA